MVCSSCSCEFFSNEATDVQGDAVVTLVYLSGSHILTTPVKSKSAPRKKTSDVVDNDDDDEAEFTDTQPVKKGKAAAQNKPASGIMNDYDEEDDDADFTDPTSDYEESNPRTPHAMRPRKVGPPTTVTNDFVLMGSPEVATGSRSMEQARKAQGMSVIHTRGTHR